MKTKLFAAGVSLLCLGMLTGCQSKETASSSNVSSESAVSEASTTNAAQSDSTAQSSIDNTAAAKVSGELKVEMNEAIATFQENYPDTDITSLELDTSFGHYFYRIDGIDDDYEYEIEIDGETKVITEKKKEMLDRDERNGLKRAEDRIDLTNVIEINDASKRAVDAVGSGTATDWELENDHGEAYWKVKVKDGLKTTKVKLQAENGAIYSIEEDD